MANSAPVNAPAVRQQGQIAPWQGNGLIVPDSRKTRPLWFNGRFLDARDLEQDQNLFLQRQADLGRAAGFGVIHGLKVDRVASDNQAPDAETIIIRAGHGITPGGELAMIANDLTVRISDLAEEENLDVQFGIATSPAPVARTRTGLYVVALRPVQFTAHPIASYPTNVQGTRTTHDGNIVEATAVSLLPYPVPARNYDASTQNAAAAARQIAAVARQIFVAGNRGQLSDSLLPLAMINIQRGAIAWLDSYLARRDSGPEFNGLRFGLSDPATHQAFLFQYDAQLQQAVNPFVQKGIPPRFAATDYFQALPAAGRFPLASIDTDKFTQLFFPQKTNVRLSIVAVDELPALIDDSISLPPIDLTLAASAYADLAVFALIPVPRQNFAALAANLPQVALTAALPQAASFQKPTDPFPFPSVNSPPPSASSGWQNAIGNQIYAYYIRRRSSPVFVTATVVTTTALVGSPIAGSPGLMLTATVSPSAATGTVTFMDSSNALGIVDLTAGAATLVVPSLAGGPHSLTAVYHGDATFAASTSATLPQTVGT